MDTAFCVLETGLGLVKLISEDEPCRIDEASMGRACTSASGSLLIQPSSVGTTSAYTLLVLASCPLFGEGPFAALTARL